MDSNHRVIGIDIGGTFGRGMRGAVVDGDARLWRAEGLLHPAHESGAS